MSRPDLSCCIVKILGLSKLFTAGGRLGEKFDKALFKQGLSGGIRNVFGKKMRLLYMGRPIES